MSLKKICINTILFIFLSIATFLKPNFLWGSDFEIFDGRMYNGQYYPRIDVIEWGKPSHMEFHIYSKKEPIELSFELENKNGKKVMLVEYHFTRRNERLCRRVLAPSHFFGKLSIYKDNSDENFNNIIVSTKDIPLSEIQPQWAFIDHPLNYGGCSDVTRKIASTSEENSTTPIKEDRTKNDETSLKSNGESVPFSTW